MNRRTLLKALLAAATFGQLPLSALALPAHREELRAWLRDRIDWQPPARLPTVIHLFLYGGASELAGNLTTLDEVRALSERPYPDWLSPGNADELSPNGFWRTAGGDLIEDMLARQRMSVYRTVWREREDNKSHPISQRQNLVGSLDSEAAGLGTLFGLLLELHGLEGRAAEELVMPLVSIGGISESFQFASRLLPEALQPVVLNARLENLFARRNNYALSGVRGGGAMTDNPADRQLEALARRVSPRSSPVHARLLGLFERRDRLDALIRERLAPERLAAVTPVDPDTGSPIAWPQDRYGFGELLGGAVRLVLANPDTRYVALRANVSWDDHSSALNVYRERMRSVQQAVATAVRHLDLMGRDDVVVNVFTEFGRNLSYNGSAGFDHGNNQVFYTAGGQGIPDRRLGAIVGRTRVIAPQPGRVFHRPEAGSFHCEPMAIASTVLRYWGVRNPEVITGFPAIEEQALPDERRVA